MADNAIDLLLLGETSDGSGFIPKDNASDSIDELAAEIITQKAAQNEDTSIEDAVNDEQYVVTDSLSNYIYNAYDDAQRARYEEGLDDRFLDCMRQYEGVYDPNERTLVEKQGGSDNFRKLTMAKCDAGMAWFIDILGGYKEPAFKISPTTMPDLPPVTKQELLNNTRQLVIEHINNMIETGQLISEAEIQEYSFEAMRKAINEEQDAIDQEAKWAADQLQQVVLDQLEQGGWDKAFKDWCHDFTIFPNAFLKGPYPEIKRTKRWGRDENGRRKAIVEYLPQVSFKRVSPFDFFPSPEAENIQDAQYCIERMKFSRQQLDHMKDMPGYSAAKIDQVIRENKYIIMQPRSYNTEYTRAKLESKSYRVVDGSTYNYSLFEAIEFWGRIGGDKLLEWGLVEEAKDKPIEYTKTYDISAIMVGNHVIKAMINEDPLGNKPYSSFCYKDVPGSFWGISLPETMQDIQKTCNSSVRAIENNQALSSGPCTMQDISQVPYGEDITSIHPYKVFQYDSSLNINNTGAKPIDFLLVPNTSIPLLNVYEAFKKEADVTTGIPAYAHGDARVGGAGNTASGLALLQGNATRGIKMVILGIGLNVIIDTVERLIDFNMLYNPDENIKGDVQVKCDGPLAVIAKEYAAQMGMQFLQATANPMDAQLIGEKNRAMILREVAKTLDMPQSPVKSDFEIERDIIDASNAEKAQQEMMMQLEQAKQQLEAAKMEQDQQRIGIEAFEKESKVQNDIDTLDAEVQMHEDNIALDEQELYLKYAAERNQEPEVVNA